MYAVARPRTTIREVERDVDVLKLAVKNGRNWDEYPLFIGKDGPQMGRVPESPFACLFVFAALAWFTMILVGFLRRRSTYNFLNVAPWRRRQLSRWLWLDSALLLVPSLGYYLSKAI